MRKNYFFQKLIDNNENNSSFDMRLGNAKMPYKRVNWHFAGVILEGGFFMSQINVSNLTFCYEGAIENVFEKVSFVIDTDWKLGFIGRNGKGKTTFLRLLMDRYVGKMEYNGTISCSVNFDYFPYEISESMMKMSASEFTDELKPGCEQWRVICELEKLGADADLLYRPFRTLSHGERTKVLLAVLFSGENEFLLIDEPTNHLDSRAREIVKEYLSGKKSFILVSHDRELLDACTDHVLVLRRKTLAVMNGNFSTWYTNQQRLDQNAVSENEKHNKEIIALHKAADESNRWAKQNENTKIGFDPVKEHDRCISTRAFIGAKTKKVMKRVKEYEKKIEREIGEKEGLLQDIEAPVQLKLFPLEYRSERLITARNLNITYLEDEKDCSNGNLDSVISNLNFEIMRGERVSLHGANGCGKSTLIKAILICAGMLPEENISFDKERISTGSGMIISYISQDTSYLRGSIEDFCEKEGLDMSLFMSILRQLDISKSEFDNLLERLSEGQKKKILIASSLVKSAHLYIWDEPLNYIDVFSRMQIEALILKFKPTLIFVEHDSTFSKKIATRTIEL